MKMTKSQSSKEICKQGLQKNKSRKRPRLMVMAKQNLAKSLTYFNINFFKL